MTRADRSDKIDPSLPHFDVRVFLSGVESGPHADHKVAELVGLPTGPAYTTDLNAVVAALNGAGAWWHLSHIEASVIPTTPAKGMEGLVSNAGRYDREGRPINYRWSFAAEQPALALCSAWIMATYDLPPAYFVEASHFQNVISKPVSSTEEMMAYYRAREEYRLEAIERFNREYPA